MLIRHNARSWNKQRARIMNFITRYGEKRITLATLHSLRALTNEQLENNPSKNIPQASIITYSEKGLLLGVGYTIADDSGHCLIVVREEARKSGIGNQIMKALIESIERFSCYVALDNIASLALCFKNQLHAVALIKGPTGKATLKFERSTSNGTSSVRNSDSIPQQ